MTRFSVRILSAAIGMILMVLNQSYGQVQLGAKAGFAVTNFLGDSDPVFESRINFTGGLTFSADLSPHLGFQPELLYAVKGSQSTCYLFETSEGLLSCSENADGNLVDLSISITYIEVPALVRYTFSPRSSISPAVSAGPVLSMNIDSRLKYRRVGTDLSFTESDESVKELDLGLAAELGADVRWDLRTISIGARYTYGLSNIIDNPDDPKHNGVFSVMVGIAL